MTYSRDIKNKIVKLYLDGDSAPEIAKKLKFSYTVVYRELKKQNIKIRSNSEANKLLSGVSEENRQKVVELYNQGYNSSQLSKIYNLSINSILSEVKSKSNTRKPNEYNRKYKINDNYFDIIDDEYKAYWLGFIATDGSIDRNKNAIKIGLQLGDAAHLEKLKRSINSEVKVKKYSYGSYFTFFSKNIKDKLISYGIVPNKSLILKPPAHNIIHMEYIKDFWRGCVDGDGGISVNNTLQLYFCGTYEMVSGFINFIEEKIKNMHKKRPRKQKNIYVVCYSGNVAVSVINLLYKDSKIFLNRKMKLAKRYL